MKNALVLPGILLVFVMSCSEDATRPTPRVLTWTVGDAVPDSIAPCYRTAFTVANHTLYAVNAFSGGYIHVNSYDRATGTWTEFRSDRPFDIYDRPTVAALGKSLYLAAGSRLLEFDVDQKTWTEKASPLISIRNGAVVALNGYVYFLGDGFLQRYAPLTDEWKLLRGMPTVRRFFTATALHGKIYVVGGRRDNGIVATVETYDPGADAWTGRAPLPLPRAGHACVVSEERLLAIGGDVLTPETYDVSASVVVYDPADNRWDEGPDMAQARYLPGAVSIDGEVLCVGGCGYSGIGAMEWGTWN